MKFEDNSIHIGDKNKIKNSNIGRTIEKQEERQKLHSKFIWNVIVPLAVGIAVVAICVWLGIQS